MMEENNRKGPGIFYAVVGVATLVVAIIGATFAYFSAADTDNTIAGNIAAAAGIKLDVTPITNTGTNMIPLNMKENDGAKDTTKQFTQAMAGKCIDGNGNHVCDVYKIVITNNSTTSAIDVRGSLTISGNEKTLPANMRWQLLDVTNDTLSTFAAQEVTDHGVDAESTIQAGATGQLVRLNVNGATGTTADNARRRLGHTETDNSATYYVVIWLEEMGRDQGSDDASKDFKGIVEFNAVDAAGNTSGITASFSVAGGA